MQSLSSCLLFETFVLQVVLGAESREDLELDTLPFHCASSVDSWTAHLLFKILWIEFGVPHRLSQLLHSNSKESKCVFPIVFPSGRNYNEGACTVDFIVSPINFVTVSKRWLHQEAVLIVPRKQILKVCIKTLELTIQINTWLSQGTPQRRLPQ